MKDQILKHAEIRGLLKLDRDEVALILRIKMQESCFLLENEFRGK